MHIVSTQFVEGFNFRQATGGATRIDLTGVMFSIDPHLIALIWCEPDEPGSGVFEVVFRQGMAEDAPEVARNVSPFTVDQGKFTYRLVKAELTFDDYGQIIAHCRIGRGEWHYVPFTLLPPLDIAAENA
jgi:hypothetical protein